MDENNSEFVIEDEPSDFSTVSSIGMEMKKMAEEIGKLKVLLIKKANSSNNSDHSSSIMQMGLQIGEKFAELKKEMMAINNENDKMKDGLKKLLKEFEELKEELARKGHEIKEMKKIIEGIKEAKTKENLAFEELKEENAKLKIKINESEERIKELSMIEQIDGIQWIKYNSIAYKLNSAGGTKLSISESGFIITKHSGPNESNSVLTNLPIPSLNLKNNLNKSTIVFYFEMLVLMKSHFYGGIFIGFCDQQFSLEGGWLGEEKNSIGIGYKDGISIEGIFNKFGKGGGWFKKGDFVGVGIIHQTNSKLESFATLNGKLLGKAKLSEKFAKLKLFPTANLFDSGDSIHLNFLRDDWQFKEFKLIFE